MSSSANLTLPSSIPGHQPYMEVDKLHPYCDIHFPIGETLAVSGECSNFSLEKAVCSHGLFMMAPNQWDPISSSLLRPLRLSDDRSVLVRIYQPSDLLIRVFGIPSLSSSQRAVVTEQVRRMLRLSEIEERKLREFHSLHAEARNSGFGRVFRSPTLFEDMVKCILLCNCQWPRTLSMANALCELQLELQNHSSLRPVVDIVTDTKNTVSDSERFCPKTPAGKESRKIRKLSVEEKPSKVDELERLESDVMQLKEKPTSNYIPLDRETNGKCEPYSESKSIGNFPSPKEIASLDEAYLAKRCKLGYRAGRILKLAQSIVEGNIQLRDLEDLCDETNSCSYFELDQKLKEINGFGPFTRANVLMCMGFYNVIPTDSETIRHLKQVHGISATPLTVQNVVEKVYRSFEPFQFLAYWLEVWNFYEERFGKSSKMPSSDYGLITASKMRKKQFMPKKPRYLG